MRIPVYTIIIAVWVSAIDMLLAAFTPALYAQVGLYVKLIVAFAIIISRLEVFASRQPLVPTFFDGLGMGLGFLLALVMIGAFRELLGNGSFVGIRARAGQAAALLRAPGGRLLLDRAADGVLQLDRAPRRRAARPRRRREGRMARRIGAARGAARAAGGDRSPWLPCSRAGRGRRAAERPRAERARRRARPAAAALSAPLADADADNFRLTDARAPDIPLPVARGAAGRRRTAWSLTVGQRLDARRALPARAGRPAARARRAALAPGRCCSP